MTTWTFITKPGESSEIANRDYYVRQHLRTLKLPPHFVAAFDVYRYEFDVVLADLDGNITSTPVAMDASTMIDMASKILFLMGETHPKEVLRVTKQISSIARSRIAREKAELQP